MTQATITQPSTINNCDQSVRNFTVSTYQSWIKKHNEYAEYFTRSKNNPAPLQPTVYADFDDIVDAAELYRTLSSLGVPVFKNFMT